MKIKPLLILITKRLAITILAGAFWTSCAKLDSISNINLNEVFKLNSNQLPNPFAPYEPTIQQPPLIEFIVDSNDSLNKAYGKHLAKIADYTKLPYANIDLNQWNKKPTVQKSTRILCFAETKKIDTKTIQVILDFVAQGGTLFFTQAVTDIRFGYLAGLKPSGNYETDVTSKGIYFNTAFLPGIKGKTIKKNVVHFGLTPENFLPSISIIATAASNPQLPIIYEHRIGNGKSICFNSTFYLEREDRGLLFAGILNGLQGIPYPIANTSTIFLDDFPSPLYDIKIQPIASEMNLNSSDFTSKVWWPDMQKLARKFNISYTAVPCFDYNANIKPAFDFSQWEATKMVANDKNEYTSSWLMKECLRNNHELGFHGYNHVSLKKDDWQNMDFAALSFKTVQKKWQVENFKDLPKTYIPPSNIIDKEGVQKLKIGMPSLQFLSSIYIGDQADGGGREFDFDPFDATLFDYPRTSAGFYMNDDKKYVQQSTYLFTGIWNHFVHPDDVYQIESIFNKSQGNFDLRNARNMGWRTTKGKKGGMYDQFENYLTEMTQLFPKIRFLNAATGGQITYHWRASSFTHTQLNQNYTVERTTNSNKSEQYWFVYVDRKNTALAEVQLQNQKANFSKTNIQNGYLFTILTKNGKLSLDKMSPKTNLSNPELLAEMANITQEYASYLLAYKKANTEKNIVWVDDYQIKLEQEIERLKTKIRTDKTIDYPTWNTYANYLSWTNQQNQVWKLLTDKYQQEPTANTVLYSRELDKIIGFPNEETQKYWLQKQFESLPEDPKIAQEYIDTFNTPENNKNITKAYQNLLKSAPTTSNYLNYIEHLIAYEPEMALAELSKTEPSMELQPLAYQITWLFADNKQYQKAYDWSKLSDKIEFKSKMYWLQELKNQDELETQYLIYAAQNPNNYEVRAIMSGMYHENNRFKESWILANSLPESKEKSELQKMLNTEVVDVDHKLQWELLDHHAALFYPEVKAKIIKEDRLKNGNFVDLKSSIETNRAQISAFDNVLSYTFYTKNKSTNTLSATYSEYTPIDLDTPDPDTIFHNSKGIQYQYKNPFSDNKPQYWTNARLEIDNFNQLFYRFGIGINASKENFFQSAELQFFPTQTAAAYSKGIYQLQLNWYQEYYWLQNISASFSLEGNYYTKNTKTKAVETLDEYDGSFTTKIVWDKRRNKKYSLVPFAEGAYSRATTTFEQGYPYWILESRLYGGGGASFRIGTTESNFKTQIDAAYFYDDFAQNFKRISNKTTYQLFDFTEIAFSFELFIQQKFYNNNAQIGIKHNFKVKRKQ